jgi:MFS family permease
LYYIHAQLKIEKAIIGKSNYVTRFIQPFTIRRIRRATLAPFTVMCGINIIAFYSSTIFTNSGFSPYQAPWASLGFGLANFLFAFPALWTIDTFSQRALLLFTFPNKAWSLLAGGICALINPSLKVHLALVAMSIYIFAMRCSILLEKDLFHLPILPRPSPCLTVKLEWVGPLPLVYSGLAS